MQWFDPYSDPFSGGGWSGNDPWGYDPWSSQPWGGYDPWGITYPGYGGYSGTGNYFNIPNDVTGDTGSPGTPGGDATGGGVDWGKIFGSLGPAAAGVLGSIFGKGGGNLPAILGGASGVIGAILQSKAQSDKNDLLKQYAEMMKGVYDTKSATGDQLSQDTLGALKQIGMMSGYNPELQRVIGKSDAAMEGLWDRFYNSQLEPHYEDAVWGAQSALQDPALRDVLDAGKRQVFNDGRTPTLDALKNYSTNTLRVNGETPELQEANKIASAIAGSGGMTPEIQQALKALQNPLQNGGGTALAQNLGQRGLDLFNREALLPMNQVLSMAKDTAAQSTKQAASAALEQAHNRGGDAVVGTGLGNQALVDFGDQAAAGQSKAITDALLGQQQLQLSQSGLGANAANAAGSLANQRFNTAVSGTSDLSGLAANKTTNALQLLSTLANTATQRIGTTGQLGLGAEDQTLKNLLGGGTMALNSLSTQGGLADILAKINTAAQSMNLNRAQGYNDTLAKLLTLNGNVGQNAMGNLMQAIAGYGQISQNYLNLGNNSLANISGILGGYGAGSPLGQFLQNTGLGMAAGTPINPTQPRYPTGNGSNSNG